MSEQPDILDDEAVEARPERTGNERVDALIDAVAGLGDRPLEEHVQVFETAHGELRRTLDS